MSFLRRLLGNDQQDTERRTAEPPASAAEVEEEERHYELELARGEQSRLSDLQQRQLKYADRAWTPPRQGGDRRADDEDTGEGTAAE